VIVHGTLDVGARRGKRRERVVVPASDAKAERLARRLALAHWIERKIEAGELRSYSHAASVRHEGAGGAVDGCAGVAGR
jgi:hypothetical protein